MHARPDIALPRLERRRFLPSSVLTFVIYEQARKVLVGEFLH